VIYVAVNLITYLFQLSNVTTDQYRIDFYLQLVLFDVLNKGCFFLSLKHQTTLHLVSSTAIMAFLQFAKCRILMLQELYIIVVTSISSDIVISCTSIF